MATSYLLDREYRQTEIDPGFNLDLHIVGRLLNAAIDGPPPNPAIERLLQQIDGGDGLRPLVIISVADSLTAERATEYRATARACRTQAWVTTAQDASDALREMAADYDRKADELEAQLTVH